MRRGRPQAGVGSQRGQVPVNLGPAGRRRLIRQQQQPVDQPGAVDRDGHRQLDVAELGHRAQRDRISVRVLPEHPGQERSAARTTVQLRQVRVELVRADLRQEGAGEVRPDHLPGQRDTGHGGEEPGQLPARPSGRNGPGDEHRGRRGHRQRPRPDRCRPANQCTRPRRPQSPRRARHTRSARPPSSRPAALPRHAASRQPGLPGGGCGARTSSISSRPSQRARCDPL